MSKQFECVPNFSEGRDRATLDAIVAEITGVPGTHLLEVSMDADHHRSVVTFVGDATAVAQAAFQAVAKARELIDLNRHHGEHPRMGAADVVPFIPLGHATLADAVAIAQAVGARIGRELEIPVFFYEAAATRPTRQNLAHVRKGEFEGLRDEIGVNPDRQPDCGPSHIHPTAGAVAVGAREFLIAYNVNLDTRDLKIAKDIAKQIREASGGFPCVKALGFELAKQGMVQVSMNMTNFNVTSLCTVFDKICELAARAGVVVLESELVGLLPAKALTDSARQYLKIKDFSDKQILDNRLLEISRDPYLAPGAFIEALAGDSPTPGGGCAAALAATLGGALNSMVCNLTVGREKFKAVDTKARELLAKSTAITAEMQSLIKADALAYDNVSKAYGLPKASAEEKRVRSAAIQAALQAASESPLQIMKKGLVALTLAGEILKIGNPNAASDLGVAALLAAAGIRGAHLNVIINLASMQNTEFCAAVRDDCMQILQQTEELERSIITTILGQLAK